MLLSLTIHNFILIDKVEINFNNGFTIITGETGSGKSILIDALLYCLGERISTDIIRKHTDKGFVESIFSIETLPHIKTILQENNYEVNPLLIIRREFTHKGTSRCFINDSPATQTFVKAIASSLADFHGQHENQLLLHHENHLAVLDAIAHLETYIDSYTLLWNQLQQAILSYQELIKQELQLIEKKEYSLFQLKEIEEISPEPAELADLEHKLSVIQHSAQLYEASNKLYSLLYSSEHSVRDSLITSQVLLQQLSTIDQSFQQYLDECTQAIASISEISTFASSYSSSLDFEENTINSIQERLSLLYRLKKKYGSYDSIFTIWNQLKEDIRIASHFDDEVKVKKEDIVRIKKELSVLALELSKKRIAAADTIKESIEHTLRSIGIEYPVFSVSIQQLQSAHDEIDAMSISIQNETVKVKSTGIDIVEFLISTNPGETPKPLSKAASGGEISRIMLAIKAMMAHIDKIPVIVLDEIDTGISGRIAQKVGYLIQDIGSKRQVIAISHSPQIAALADNHILVQKNVIDDRAFVTTTILSNTEKVEHIASLISGNNITASSYEHALELIQAKKLQ